ncbi:MAG: hypothetical protein ACYCZD_07400 [Rhodanobacter sp.]
MNIDTKPSTQMPGGKARKAFVAEAGDAEGFVGDSRMRVGISG